MGQCSNSTLRSSLIRLAHQRPDLRPHLLPLITPTKVAKGVSSFEESIKGKKFRNPNTGNDVTFKSLPAAEQKKLRSQWDSEGADKDTKKKDTGSPSTSKELDALLKDRQESIKKLLPEELAKYPEAVKVKDLDDDHKALVEDYKIDIVGDDAVAAAVIAKKLRSGIQAGADICRINPPICVGNMGLTRDKMPQIIGGDSVKTMRAAMSDKDYEAANQKVEEARKAAKGKTVDIKSVLPDKKTRDAWEARSQAEAMIQAGADPDSDKTVLSQMLDHLAGNGIKTTRAKVSVGRLKATQKEIQAGKTYSMADAHLKGKIPGLDSNILVSRDGHILDGHHRWAALLTVDPSRKMDVQVIDMDMEDLLKEAASMPGVFRADIDGLPLPEKDQKAYKAKNKSTLSKKSSKISSFLGDMGLQDRIDSYWSEVGAFASPEVRAYVGAGVRVGYKHTPSAYRYVWKFPHGDIVAVVEISGDEDGNLDIAVYGEHSRFSRVPPHFPAKVVRRLGPTPHEAAGVVKSLLSILPQ